MPTIKDVARLAGVSHGTVSNVLRGSKNVKLDNVIKVKNAMKELGYQPDLSAQSLKSGSTSNVAIVLPDISDPVCTSFFSAVSDTLSSMGYTISLNLTRGIASVERNIIRKELSARAAGMIIMSSQPENSDFFKELSTAETKLVFVERQIKNYPSNFICCENRRSIRQAVHSLYERGYRRIALLTGFQTFSSENQCLKGYEDAIEEIPELTPDPDLAVSADFMTASAFSTAISLLNKNPDAIICSSSQFLNGIEEAIHFKCCENPPHLVALAEETWADNRYLDVDIIPRHTLEMGIQAANLLDESISSGSFSETRHISIPNSALKKASGRIPQAVPSRNKTLRVAAIAGESADAFRNLSPHFTRLTGIDLEIDSFPQEELYDFIISQSADSGYDVFAVDVLWFREFAEKGLLKNLTSSFSYEDLESMNLQPELRDDFAYYKGQLYGFPFMYCNQLLFYRSDLFENTTYQRMFFEQYRQELRVPQNWTEYNAVARFFTKEFNPDSPTTYGTTLGSRFSCAALIEFLPRLWANSGDVFDRDGHVILDEYEAKLALANYCESFKYASPGSSENWWDEQVQEFISGDAAMMIMYSSYVSGMTDPQKSKIIGKYGFAEIPGRMPVLGGWSFAVNQGSVQPEEAVEFIKWACALELSIPNTILGNLSASKTVFDSNEIFMLYPWVRESLAIFPTSGRRALPENKKGASIQRYEQIIARAVHDSVTGAADIDEALKAAAAELKKL